MPLVDTVDQSGREEDDSDEGATAASWRLPRWALVAGLTLAALKVFSIAGWPQFGVYKVTPEMLAVPRLGPGATGIVVLAVCVAVASAGLFLVERSERGDY